MICANCGFVGPGKRSMKGSFIIELGLWLFFIIPGLIYSIWRLSTKASNVCPKCSQPNMIPADTPIGKRMIVESGVRGAGIQTASGSNTSALSKVGIGLVLFILLILVLGAMGF